jgi:UDP-N-acetylglucosamine 2-epimerase
MDGNSHGKRRRLGAYVGSRPVKILSFVGNPPQCIKSGRLSVALRDQGIEENVVHTGQHYDRAG